MSYIIHVDNSDFFRKVTNSFLIKLGFESNGFSRGEDAIDAVLSRMADCIITGLELADMSGEEFIRQLAVSAEMVPIIVITSKEDEEQNKRLSDLGVKAIIQKESGWQNILGQQLEGIKN